MIATLILAPWLSGSLAAAAAPPVIDCPQFTQSVAKGEPAQKLKSFLDLQWKYEMTEHPVAATFHGYPGQNDRWPDESMAAKKRRDAIDACQLTTLRSISRAKLSSADRLNYDLAERELKLGIEGQAFGGEYLPINHMGGIQTEIVSVLTAMPAASVSNYRDMLSRLDKFPTLVDQEIAAMQEGMQRGIMPTKMFLPKVIEQIDKLTTGKVQDSPIYKPFVEMNSAIAKNEQDSLRGEAQQIITDHVFPALSKLKEFLKTKYIPAARETIAWSALPKGKEWYAYMVKIHTTTAKTPDQLHAIGLSEVARIHETLLNIMHEAGFKGSLKEFNQMLLTDSRFYFSNPEDLLRAFRDITKRIDPELTHMFKTLPRLTYGVREVPAFRAPSSPAGEYEPGTLEAGRAGWFEANTYDLKTRPTWEMETLAFHETVPGHHMQIAIAQEIKGIPEFRRFEGNTAYEEGWALYAESLGEEMGFYKDPYSRFGHYADEMLRAVRLVVDTGMHAKGWTRQQAIDYYKAQMPASDDDATVEIDRYIVWPGQALAYKVGQMKIRELRDRATAALGEKFDVRLFHDLILGQGPLPMDVLESQVDHWISEQKKKAKI